MTNRLEESIREAEDACRSGPTAAIFDPSISTSALSKSPSFASMVKTTPPFSSMRSPGPPPRGMPADSTDAQADRPAPPTTPATSSAAARNSRRDNSLTPSARSWPTAPLVRPDVSDDCVSSHMRVLLLVVVAFAALEPRHYAPGPLLEERRGSHHG